MKQKLKGLAYLLSMSCGLCICFFALIPWIALLPVKFKPIQEFRKYYRVFLNGLYFSYASSLTHLLCQTTVVLHYNEKDDNVLNNNKSVLMCNHRSRVDIVYAGWSLGAFQQTFPYIVVMLKDDLKKIPIFGWCMQMIMYIFLSRKRDTDIPNIKRMLNYWISQNIDFWLFLFPEGTDLSESRKKENNEYARSKHLRELNYVLYPKTGALFVCLDAFRETKYSLIDITIAYTDFIKGERPSEAGIVNGRFPREVHLFLRSLRIEDVPKEESEMKKWLSAIFFEKECLLKDWYENGYLSPQFSGKYNITKTSQSISKVYQFRSLIFLSTIGIIIVYLFRWFRSFRFLCFLEVFLFFLLPHFSKEFSSFEMGANLEEKRQAVRTEFRIGKISSARSIDPFVGIMHPSPKLARRNSAALKNVVVRRNSLNTVVNLNALVRVFFLDGSSKVLQMFENSTAKDVLIALKFNLDLSDISTHALFRVLGGSLRRIELTEVVSEVLKDPTDSGQEVRLLFKSWINFKYGGFDNEVFQYGSRVKQANTALWLAYMEAVFMVTTEKLYLTEDESLILGCLKMQAESGDFRPEVHSLDVIKNRVVGRFPNPIRNKMKALCSPTLAGNGVGNDLALRVQTFYARLSGKTKVDAQLDYLSSLRTFCPFYGSSFYDVHCQYDENPLEQDSTPPVIMMVASIGPLAITLMTQTEPPVVMRHPYKRIIKWISYPDKHIFTYWVIKPQVSFADIEEYQDETSGDLDTKRFCDCVYLVTSQVNELEYLVKSYVETIANQPPVLPFAEDELLPPSVRKLEQIAAQQPLNPIQQPPREKPRSRVSRIGLFWNALGGKTDNQFHSGSGLNEDGGDDIFCDDVAGINGSFFHTTFKSIGKNKSPLISGSDDDIEADANMNKIPASIQYAASMSELKRLAEEEDFSDSDEDESQSGAEDEENHDSEDSVEKADDLDSNENEAPVERNKSHSMKAFKRASNILFGSFGKDKNPS